MGIRNPTLLRALPSPLVSLATNQLSARGRGSNVWVSPHGCLTFSLVLRPPSSLPTSSLVFIQYLAGLVITETCRELMGEEAGNKVRLKWPNDVYARVGAGDGVSGKGQGEWRKIGGILVSTNFSGGKIDIVIGTLY